MEDEIDGEGDGDHMVDDLHDQDLFLVESHVEHCGEAGVAHDYHDHGVEYCLPRSVVANDEVF